MRNVAQHTSLADIVLIRRLISFHSLIPLPADAVVTPITFVVPRQTGSDVARGFLRYVPMLAIFLHPETGLIAQGVGSQRDRHTRIDGRVGSGHRRLEALEEREALKKRGEETDASAFTASDLTCVRNGD